MAALVALLAAPAFAAGHCDHVAREAEAQAADGAHGAGDGGGHHHHHAMAVVAETVPAGDTNGETACLHHVGEACQCKSQMALSCAMEGCGIKADGPLSTGFNDRFPTDNDHALGVETVLPGMNGQTVSTTLFQMLLPRALTGPDPRPPSA